MNRVPGPFRPIFFASPPAPPGGGGPQSLPADPPRTPTDYPYVRALGQRPRLISGQTLNIGNAEEVTICKVEYPEPTHVTAYAAVDLFKNEVLQQLPSGAAVFMQDTGANELFMLGRIRIGCQLTYIDANFDIPAGQLVVIPTMAESLEITARFYGTTDRYANAIFGGSLTFTGAVNPVPLGTAPTTLLPSGPVAVTGFIGPKGPTTGNALRKFRFIPNLLPAAKNFVLVPVPNLASAWRFLGGITPGSTATPDITSASWILPNAGGNMGPIDLDRDWQPIPPGAVALRLALAAATPNGNPFEVDFKIGFDGLGT